MCEGECISHVELSRMHQTGILGTDCGFRYLSFWRNLSTRGAKVLVLVFRNFLRNSFNYFLNWKTCSREN